jgi:hypothetical protein
MRDPRIPLRASPGMAVRLERTLGAHAQWHPLCRILGIVEQESRGQSLAALEVSLRTPLAGVLAPDQSDSWRSRMVPWTAALLAEAHDTQFGTWDKDTVWLKALLPKLEASLQRLRTQQPPLSDAAIATRLNAEVENELRNEILLDIDYQALAKAQNDPYTGEYGFWTALATLLPAWRDRLPLAPAEVELLLQWFDAAFAQKWKHCADVLSAAGVMRFTPDAIATVRARIAGLAAPAPESS